MFPPGANVAPVNMLPPLFMLPVVNVKVPKLLGGVTLLSGTYGASPWIPIRVAFVSVRVPVVTPVELKSPPLCVKTTLVDPAKAADVVHAMHRDRAASFISFISTP